MRQNVNFQVPQKYFPYGVTACKNDKEERVEEAPDGTEGDFDRGPCVVKVMFVVDYDHVQKAEDSEYQNHNSHKSPIDKLVLVRCRYCDCGCYVCLDDAGEELPDTWPNTPLTEVQTSVSDIEGATSSSFWTCVCVKSW